jgi:hypothetical protein
VLVFKSDTGSLWYARMRPAALRALEPAKFR